MAIPPVFLVVVAVGSTVGIAANIISITIGNTNIATSSTSTSAGCVWGDHTIFRRSGVINVPIRFRGICFTHLPIHIAVASSSGNLSWPGSMASRDSEKS